jgi:hypothetical protein
VIISKKQSYEPAIDDEYWIVTLTMEKVKQTPSLIFGKKGMPILLDQHVTKIYRNKFKKNAIDKLIEDLQNDYF